MDDSASTNASNGGGTFCDECGRWFAWADFAETIEEHLCEECASGLCESELDDESWIYGDSDY